MDLTPEMTRRVIMLGSPNHGTTLADLAGTVSIDACPDVKGVKTLVVLSAGFAETGSAGAARRSSRIVRTWCLRAGRRSNV